MARRSGIYDRHPRASTSARPSLFVFETRQGFRSRGTTTAIARYGGSLRRAFFFFPSRLFLPSKSNWPPQPPLGLSLPSSFASYSFFRPSSSYRDIPLGSAPSSNTSHGPFDVVSPSSSPPPTAAIEPSHDPARAAWRRSHSCIVTSTSATKRVPRRSGERSHEAFEGNARRSIHLVPSVCAGCEKKKMCFVTEAYECSRGAAIV